MSDFTERVAEALVPMKEAKDSWDRVAMQTQRAVAAYNAPRIVAALEAALEIMDLHPDMPKAYEAFLKALSDDAE